MAKNRPYCLTIAGFDPSGGAGILADIKTFEQFRLQGLAVQTANTIQTGETFVSVNWIDKQLIADQLSTLLKAYPIRHFKIGLIEDGDGMLALLKAIRAATPTAFIVWDPVLRPSAGGDLQENRFQKVLPEILKLVSVITPNIPEFEMLFGKTDPITIAAETGCSIYLKGGHAEARKGKDFFYTPVKCYPINPARVSVSEKHGSGCVLSASLLSVHALGYPVVKGLLTAKRYTEKILSSNETKLGYHS